ncbi:tubulin-like doman-containing protein [Corynebacterium riegelii]|uniref:tubulin-like doman-containing protein n=1 Tax=Corynebacterium riegelii TaxID=156976 RepID=UPI00191CC9CC|nr:tubulin-like doman-containing protein [Corynebacterium riegelii]QQU84334.1 hypothetical protein I6I71_01705 [Corynebacterium riegelii]
MYKVFVVGCGGSGAKTMSYMMDELKATLEKQAPQWWAKNKRLPDAWKFVSIDAPLVPEVVENSKLPSVTEAGGDYVACGSNAGLPSVRQNIAAAAASEAKLGTLANWALKDHTLDNLNVARGAGQYRGVGRILILNRLKEVNAQLNRSWAEVISAETDADLAAIAAETGQSKETDGPIVFIISSMAGGSGASMAVDVCRLVSALPGIDNGGVGLYMVTPDVFTGGADAPMDKMAGTNPNALAMFAELAAGQAGAGSQTDAATYQALGLNIPVNSLPVGRIFPVGRTVGTDDRITEIGNGTPSDIYRSLGLGLASLFTDHQAMANYVAHIMNNPQSKRSPMYGWGAVEYPFVPWSTFGYGRVAMGRERYAEYSAQRLARWAVDHITSGHFDRQEIGKDEAQQLRDRVESNWAGFRDNMGTVLPLASDPMEWIGRNFGGVINDWVAGKVSAITQSIPNANKQKGNEWLAVVERELGNASQRINAEFTRDQRSERPFYGALVEWAGPEALQRRLLDQLRHEVGKHGAAYAQELLHRLQGELKNTTVPKLEQYQVQPWITLDGRLRDRISGLGRIPDSTEYLQLIRTAIDPALRQFAVAFIASQIAELLRSFDNDFIKALDAEISRQRDELRSQRMVTSDPEMGISRLETIYPSLWPAEGDGAVDSRFGAPATEASITPIDEFKDRFEEHIQNARPNGGDDTVSFDTGLGQAGRAVVSGDWHQGADPDPAPRDLLSVRDGMWWIPQQHTVNPHTGERVDYRKPRFDFKIGSKEVLERSRKFINRTGTSFATFVSESLADYVDADGHPAHERARREDLLEQKFSLALELALPLAQVDKAVLQELLGTSVAYDFVFTTIPFKNHPLERRMKDALTAFKGGAANIDSHKSLDDAFGNNGGLREISITGSFEKYPPVVFSSVLPRAAAQWDAYSTPTDRDEFWRMRRARPLSAALPMSDIERGAMIRGYFVGKLTGRIYHSEEVRATADNDPIQIYDVRTNSQTRDKWLTIATPLLTPPHALGHRRNYLPAILENATMAWAKISQPPVMGSIQPYLALRALWDEGDMPTQWRPQAGLYGDNQIVNHTSGQDVLRHWLWSGQRPNGEFLMVEGTGPNVTPEQRLAAAKEWLQKERELAVAYSPAKAGSGDGFLGGQTENPYGDIRDMQIAYALPLFADLTPDYIAAIDDLLVSLDWAFNSGDPRASQQFQPQPTQPTPPTGQAFDGGGAMPQMPGLD